MTSPRRIARGSTPRKPARALILAKSKMPGPIDAILTSESREILRKTLEAAYVRGATEAISERDAWGNAADVAEAISKIMAGVTSILSFASGTYKSTTLSFAAGCMGTAGVTLAGFATYASRESRERAVRLNGILRDVDMSPVDLPPEDTRETTPTTPTTPNM